MFLGVSMRVFGMRWIIRVFDVPRGVLRGRLSIGELRVLLQSMKLASFVTDGMNGRLYRYGRVGD